MARRVLLLITDLEIGGTPTVVREVAARLNALQKAHVEVACLSRWGPVADQLRESGVFVTAFGARSSIELPLMVRKLHRLIREHRIDTVFSFLVHANTVAAIVSPFCSRVRFIQSIQTTQPFPRWHWWVQRAIHHVAEKIVVPSPSAAKVAHARAGVPDDEIVVIPNAIDPPEFRGMGNLPMPSPSHGQVARATFTVGFIGRLDPVKRIPDLLHALAALEDRFRLSIFGDGPERRRIESLVDRLGITDRVTMHGTIAKPQVALGQIDVLVLPSQAEGFGLVLIEAMAAGVPVVATDVPGICDVVRHGETGLLVPVASPESLANAIERIASDDALRARLVENALADVRTRFTWDVVLPQYADLLMTGTRANTRFAPTGV